MYCIVTVVRFVIILIKFYVCMYGLTSLRYRGGVIIQFEQPTHRGGPRGRRCDMCSMLPRACFISIPLPPSHPGPILLCPSHTPTCLLLFRLFSGPDLKVLRLFGYSNIMCPRHYEKYFFGSAHFSCISIDISSASSTSIAIQGRYSFA